MCSPQPPLNFEHSFLAITSSFKIEKIPDYPFLDFTSFTPIAPCPLSLSSSSFWFWGSFLVNNYWYQGAVNTKKKETSISLSFTTCCHVSFHVIWFFNTSEDITKNSWLWRFGKFLGIIFDRAYFSKITRQQCLLRKKPMLNQHFNKVATL